MSGFSNVFPKELLGCHLSSKRSLRIILVLGATPVAKSTYWLILTVQLLKFLPRISLSTARWGWEICSLPWCIASGSRCHANATRQGDSLCSLTAENREWNYPTHELELGAVYSSLSFEDTISIERDLSYTLTIREFWTLVRSAGVEHETDQMVWCGERSRLGNSLPPRYN